MNNINTIRIGNEETYLHIIPVLHDNYAYLLSRDGHALIIDPGDSEPILTVLEERSYRLAGTLITHHHADHTKGNERISNKTDSPVIGPADDRIPHLRQSVADDEELVVEPFTIEVIATPGHACPHVTYFFRDLKLLFSGDLLFGAGCGRIIEGTAEEMFASLQKIKKLPDDTQVLFGHEYTKKNLEFALFIEPDNQAVRDRLEQVCRLREKHTPTVPANLAKERSTNPFLRTDDKHLASALGMENASPRERFIRLRNLRDEYR